MGNVRVLEAYFDESERSGGIFAVAGFLFTPADAKKFAREWRALMGGVWPFHMVDLTSGRGAFKGVSQRQRDGLLRAAVALINQRVTLGVAISCRLAEVHALAPRWIDGMGHAYALCCHLSMGAVGNWIRDGGRADRVAYVFEAGYGDRGEAQRFMARVCNKRDATETYEFYRYHSHSFQPKGAFGHLQAADIFAWEWSKFYDETFEQQLRPLRGSLRALLARDTSRYRTAHITGVPLRDFMDHMWKTGLEELRERRGHPDSGASLGIRDD